MLVALPVLLRINDARKRKFELFASLTPLEVNVLDVASAVRGSHVFGHRPGKRDSHDASRGRIVLIYRSPDHGQIGRPSDHNRV